MSRKTFRVDNPAQLDYFINEGTVAFGADSISPEMQKLFDAYREAGVLRTYRKIPEAIQILRDQLKSYPTFVAARHNIAIYLTNIGNPTEALQHLKIAHRYAPRDPDIHRVMGGAYSVLGDKQSEIQAYKDAIADDKNDLRAMIVNTNRKGPQSGENY